VARATLTRRFRHTGEGLGAALRKGYLDAVRAFAAFLVVVVHTGQFFPASNHFIQLFAAMGQLGVQLFFVLSAFLIFESLDRLRGKALPFTAFSG
jgi:peptidoglycan/LPS O-acetylase OafA/YrhL